MSFCVCYFRVLIVFIGNVIVVDIFWWVFCFWWWLGVFWVFIFFIWYIIGIGICIWIFCLLWWLWVVGVLINEIWYFICIIIGVFVKIIGLIGVGIIRVGYVVIIGVWVFLEFCIFKLVWVMVGFVWYFIFIVVCFVLGVG